MFQLTVAGNIGKDAELKELSGMLCISFTIAINQSYTDKNNQKIEKTIWVNCSRWQQKGSKTGIVQYLKKGTKVLVQGTPNINTWRDKDNNFRADFQLRVEFIELMGAAVDKPQQESQGNSFSSSSSSTGYTPQPHEITEPMDDLPF